MSPAPPRSTSLRPPAAAQVRNHIWEHCDALEELPRQPWLRALGPGLVHAVQTLHERYRNAQQQCPGDGDVGCGDAGAAAGAGEHAALQREATFSIPELDRQASLAPGSARGHPNRSVVHVNVVANSNVGVFSPPVPPPPLSTCASALTFNPSTASTCVAGGAAFFAQRPGGQACAGEASAAPAGLHFEMVALKGNGNSAASRPDQDRQKNRCQAMLLPVTSYPEMLRRICPSGSAVNAALAAEGEAATGAAGEGADSGGSLQFLTRVRVPIRNHLWPRCSQTLL